MTTLAFDLMASPLELSDGPLALVLLYALTLLLHLLLPALTVEGYCCGQNNEVLQYRLNGFVVYISVAAIYLYAVPEDIQLSFYHDGHACVLTANSLGLVASLYFHLRGGREKYSRCVTVDQLSSLASLKEDREFDRLNTATKFFLGHEWNPRFLGQRLDVKMFLYILGATALQINIMSCVLFQYRSLGRVTNALKAYTFMFTWFLSEYLLCEHVHLYTYDLFAERIGFKLIWGCMVFYPFFYCIGCYPLARMSGESDLSALQSGLCIGLFLCGWIITRGANLQKYFFRRNPRDPTFFFGLIPQRAIGGTRILCSGFWAAARHFNYCGEIIQGLALSLPGALVSTGYGRAVPLLYPLYYTLLFVTRQNDDDAVCSRKYGSKWSEYVERVPYRMVPGVY